MSDLRYDPIFGQWAVIAERRQSRPLEFQQFSQRRAGIDCPFCRGNESVTPPAIEAWSADGLIQQEGDDWIVRVLPNKYPALDASLRILTSLPSRDRLDRRSGAGAVGASQEVIVLSPRHVVSLSGLSDAELYSGFQVFQKRVHWNQQQPGIQHVCLFMNCRPLAGASIEHSHFQLISSPICTDQVESRTLRMQQDSGTSGLNLWQACLHEEMNSGERVLESSDHFLVYCPFASRYSNQIRIAPRCSTPFEQLAEEPRQQFARLCRKWITAIERCLDDPAYNIIFHLPPVPASEVAWFVDLVPRFPQAAGFELATDCWVNPVSPESAAVQFREFAKAGAFGK